MKIIKKNENCGGSFFLLLSLKKNVACSRQLAYIQLRSVSLIHFCKCKAFFEQLNCTPKMVTKNTTVVNWYKLLLGTIFLQIKLTGYFSGVCHSWG